MGEEANQEGARTVKESVITIPDEVVYLREHPEALHMVRLFMNDISFFEAWERVYLLLKNTNAEEISKEEIFLITHAGAMGLIREMMNTENETAKFRVINSYANLINNRKR